MTCTELEGVREVVWQVDPTRWLATPSDPFFIVTSDETVPAICSSVTIDGQEASDEAIRRLIQVHRLVGDETLIESLTDEIASLQEEVGLVRMRSPGYRNRRCPPASRRV